MPSRSFVVQKLIGREFEQAMIPILQEKGMRVIDVDHWGYRHKKGRDVIVEVKGERSSIEFKLDKMSERTGRVCIDLDSLGKTDSKYWIFGLPKNGQIEVYAMYSQALKDFVRKAPREWYKKAGEFGAWNIMPPKHTFISQSFISKFGVIDLPA